MSAPKNKRGPGDEYAAVYRERGDGDLEFVALLTLDSSIFPMLSQADSDQALALIETLTNAIEEEGSKAVVLYCPDPDVPAICDRPITADTEKEISKKPSGKNPPDQGFPEL
jgi:hypothetical protein